MDKYTIYCTEEQTKKALKLGAPIKVIHKVRNDGITEEVKFVNPTTEQMIGWLEEQGYYIEIRKSFIADFQSLVHNTHITIFYGECFLSRKEATLVAIDAVLDYLENIRQ